MPVIMTIPLTRVYPSQAVVGICSLIFALILSLRADGFIDASLWAAFAPQFLVDAICFSGALVGYILYCRAKKQNELIEGDVEDIKAMLSTTMLFVFKFIFQVLLCCKLENNADIHWMVVFLPLYFSSLLAWWVVWYQARLGRIVHYELLVACNFLVALFVPLQLSGIVHWTWQALLTPIWIELVIHALIMIFYLVKFFLSLRSDDSSIEQRVEKGAKALAIVLIVAPLTAFFIMLAKYLDGASYPYITLVTLPLLLMLATVVWMSFLQAGGNRWWFGLRVYSHELRLHMPHMGRTSYATIAGDDVERAPTPVPSISHTIQDVVEDEEKVWVAPPPYQSILSPD